MLMGELIKIDKDVISSNHRDNGDNKCRHRPAFLSRGEGYSSMYPLTEDTTLICLFSNLNEESGIYYIPAGEELLRKYPKRILHDSLVNIYPNCGISIINRIVDSRRLPPDVKIAHLYIAISRISESGMVRLLRHSPNPADLVGLLSRINEVSGTKVKELAKEDHDKNIISDLTAVLSILQTTLLAHGSTRTAEHSTVIGSNLKNCFGSILSSLCSPNAEQQQSRYDDIRDAPVTYSGPSSSGSVGGGRIEKIFRANDESRSEPEPQLESEPLPPPLPLPPLSSPLNTKSEYVWGSAPSPYKKHTEPNKHREPSAHWTQDNIDELLRAKDRPLATPVNQIVDMDDDEAEMEDPESN